MTITSDEELEALRKAGQLVARTLTAMVAATRAGMTTGELDALGRTLIEEAGGRSAPELSYDFPGATCISIFPEIAHGIPGDRAIEDGDLVNIDVSAELDGYFADAGHSFVVGKQTDTLNRLCRDGKRALWAGIKAVKSGRPLGDIGERVQVFADRNRYTLIRNLSSHGVGRSLHEEPTAIATWREPDERRTIANGAVFTIEPFLSTGSHWAGEGGDGWTLIAEGGCPTVQFEHTLVATPKGAIIVTQP